MSKPTVSPHVAAFRALLVAAQGRRAGDTQIRALTLLNEIYRHDGATQALIELHRMPRELITDERGRNITAALMERWLPEVPESALLDVAPPSRPDVVVLEMMRRGNPDGARVLAHVLRSEALRRQQWERVARLDAAIFRSDLSTDYAGVVGRLVDALMQVPSNEYEARHEYAKLVDEVLSHGPSDVASIDLAVGTFARVAPQRSELMRALGLGRLRLVRALIADDRVDDAVVVCSAILEFGDSAQIVSAATAVFRTLDAVGRLPEAEGLVSAAILRTLDRAGRRQLQCAHARILHATGRNDQAFALFETAFAQLTLLDAVDPAALRCYADALAARGDQIRANWARSRAEFEQHDQIARGL